MTTPTALDRGRTAYREHRFADAAAGLDEADREHAVAASDLEHLAMAAILLGRFEEGIDALTRAHEAYLAEEDVDAAARHGEPVARRLRDEHVPADQLAQRRDRVLQRTGRGCRRRLSPEICNQAVGRYDLTGTQRQGGEQRTLLPARQRDDPVAVPDLQGPKEADFHRIGCNTDNKSFQVSAR